MLGAAAVYPASDLPFLICQYLHRRPDIHTFIFAHRYIGHIALQGRCKFIIDTAAKLTDTDRIFVVSLRHSGNKAFQRPAVCENFPAQRFIENMDSGVFFIKIPVNPVNMPFMLQIDDPLVIAALLPWLKSGIIIFGGSFASASLYAEQHRLNKMMYCRFTRFIAAVNNINPV